MKYSAYERRSFGRVVKVLRLTRDKILTPLAIGGVNKPALVIANPTPIPIPSFIVGTKAFRSVR